MDALIPKTVADFDQTANALLECEPDSALVALRDQYRSHAITLIDVAKGQSDMPIDIKRSIISDVEVEDTSSVFVSDHYDRDDDAVYMMPPPSFDDVVSTFGSDFGGPDRYSDKDVWSDFAEFDQVEDLPALYYSGICEQLAEWCECSLLLRDFAQRGPDDGDQLRALNTPLGRQADPVYQEPEAPEPEVEPGSYFESMAELLEFVHEDYEAAAHYASLIDAVRVDDRPRGKLRVDRTGVVTGDVFAGVPADGAARISGEPLPGTPTRPAAGMPAPEVHPFATMRSKLALATHTPPGVVGPHHAAYFGGEAIPRKDQGGPLADMRISWLARLHAGLEQPPTNEVGCYRATIWESFAAWRLWLRGTHTTESLRELGVLGPSETARDLPLRREGAPRRRWVSTPEGEVIVPMLGYEGQDLIGEVTGYVPAKPDRPTEGESPARLASDHWVEHFLLD